MKNNRTIFRFLLPLLFVVLLSVGVILLVSAGNPANDDIGEDLLRFDLLSDEKKATQVCAWSGNGTDYYLFLPSFADPDAAVFTPLHGSKIMLDDKPLQKGDSLSSLETDRSYSLTVPGNAKKNLTLTMMRSSDIPALFVMISGRAMEKVLSDKEHKEKASLLLFRENGLVEYEGKGLDEIKGRGNSSWTLDKKNTQNGWQLKGNGKRWQVINDLQNPHCPRDIQAHALQLDSGHEPRAPGARILP